jgi:hypothetical protein
MIGSRLLAFELTENPETIEIHFDREGATDAVRRLRKLAKQSEPRPDHDHWMTDRAGGSELTNFKKSSMGKLLEVVTIRYRPKWRGSRPVQQGGQSDGKLLSFQRGIGRETLEIVCDEGGIRSLVESFNLALSRCEGASQGTGSTHHVVALATTGSEILDRHVPVNTVTLHCHV